MTVVLVVVLVACAVASLGCSFLPRRPLALVRRRRRPELRVIRPGDATHEGAGSRAPLRLVGGFADTPAGVGDLERLAAAGRAPHTPAA